MESTSTPKIFNPLVYLAEKRKEELSQSAGVPSDAVQTSESAVFNTTVGICHKCKEPMTRAKMANGDEVFWCETDRVSSLMPDA